MASTTGSARAAALIIERLTETVIIDGERVDLPPREFALLAALASRPGTAIHTKKLVMTLWPDTPGMTAQDVYVVMSYLRKRLREGEREHKLIQNQPRVGYVLDLPPDRVVVVDDLDRAPDSVVHLDQPLEEAPPPAQPQLTPVDGPAAAVRNAAPMTRRTMGRSALTAASVMVAIAVSWSAGYLISSQRPQPNDGPNVAAKQSSEQPTPTENDPRQEERPRKNRREDSPRKKRRSSRSAPDTAPGTGVAAPLAPEAPSQHVAPDAPAQTSQQESVKAPGAEPKPLPPAPTRFLYHLVNQESGDHLVTTDGNVASQYQARGYEGGAIGRVYTSPTEGTRAISTNQGTAYIFIDSAPKTEPASRVSPLWHATDGAGDFFYSTRETEAKRPGWSARIVGYVGTL